MNKHTDNELTTLDEMINGCKTAVIPSLAELTTNFIASKNDIAANDLLPVFLRLIQTHGEIPFTYLDFYLSAVYLDISRDVLQSIFDDWRAYLNKHKRIRTTLAKDSSYSYDSYHFER
jgi:hypothetical protein